MSVKVTHLTKLYAQQRAVDDVSFEAHSGEVLGFLGPNGAGQDHHDEDHHWLPAPKQWHGRSVRIRCV